MDAEKHKRIEQRDYAVWQTEGQPHGRHEEHWQLAARQIEAEDGARYVVEPKKRRIGESLARKSRRNEG